MLRKEGPIDAQNALLLFHVPNNSRHIVGPSIKGSLLKGAMSSGLRAGRVG